MLRLLLLLLAWPLPAAADQDLDWVPGADASPAPAAEMRGHVAVRVRDRRPHDRNGDRSVGSYVEINRTASFIVGLPVVDRDEWMLPEGAVSDLFDRIVRHALHAEGIWAAPARRDAPRGGGRLQIDVRDYWCHAAFTKNERCRLDVEATFTAADGQTWTVEVKDRGRTGADDPWEAMLDGFRRKLQAALRVDANRVAMLAAPGPRFSDAPAMLAGGRLVERRIDGADPRLDLVFGDCAWQDGEMLPFDPDGDAVTFEPPAGRAGRSWVYGMRPDGSLLSVPLAGPTADGPAVATADGARLLRREELRSLWMGELPGPDEVCEAERTDELVIDELDRVARRGLADLQIRLELLMGPSAELEVSVAVDGPHDGADLVAWIDGPHGTWQKHPLLRSTDPGRYGNYLRVKADPGRRTYWKVYVAGTVTRDGRRRPARYGDAARAVQVWTSDKR